jgi:Rrf2 family protein
MRITTKGRYGLAAMICIAEKNGKSQNVADIAKKLNISKIYLEHVFSLMRNNGLVQSVKGAQGGYFLCFEPEKITVCDILRATESGLFDDTERSVGGSAEYIEACLQALIWKPLDKCVTDMLTGITLQDLLNKSKNTDYMFYI